MLEGQVLEPIRHGLRLGKDQLQLLPEILKKRRIGLCADADPIDAIGCRHRSVGFHGDFEPLSVKGPNEWRIQLHERFAARADHQFGIAFTTTPYPRNVGGHGFGRPELSASVPIHPHEIRVAEGADRRSPVPLQAAPQVAAREAQEDGRAACLAALALALALNGQEDFLG